MYKRDGIWWTCIRHRGGKFSEALKQKNKKLAESIEAKLRTELVEGKFFDRLEGERRTFQELMQNL